MALNLLYSLRLKKPTKLLIQSSVLWVLFLLGVVPLLQAQPTPIITYAVKNDPPAGQPCTATGVLQVNVMNGNEWSCPINSMVWTQANATGGGATAPATPLLYKGNNTLNGIIPAIPGTDYFNSATQIATGGDTSGTANAITVARLNGVALTSLSGLARFTGGTPSNAVFGNVVSLFGGGSCVGALLNDGTCVVPGGTTAPATILLYKGNNSVNGIIPATPGTDYVVPINTSEPISQISGTSQPYSYVQGPSAVGRTATSKFQEMVSPKDSMSCNGLKVTGSMTNGGFTITSATSFSSTSVGYPIQVEGAGPAGIALDTTIASVSSGVPTLTDAASTAVTSVGITFGHDDGAALNTFFQQGLNQANGQHGLQLPNGTCVTTQQIAVTGGTTADLSVYGQGLHSKIKFISPTHSTVSSVLRIGDPTGVQLTTGTQLHDFYVSGGPYNTYDVEFITQKASSMTGMFFGGASGSCLYVAGESLRFDHPICSTQPQNDGFDGTIPAGAYVVTGDQQKWQNPVAENTTGIAMDFQASLDTSNIDVVNAQLSKNLHNIHIAPAGGGFSSPANIHFSGGLAEASTGVYNVLIEGNFNQFTGMQISNSNATGAVRTFEVSGQGNIVDGYTGFGGGSIGLNVLLDATAEGNIFNPISTSGAVTITDNSTSKDTQWGPMIAAGGVAANNQPYQEWCYQTQSGTTDPTCEWSGKWTTTSSTALNISTKVFTTGKAWRATFNGQWINASGAPVACAGPVELTDTNNVVIGCSATQTFSVDGSTGKFKLATSTPFGGFSGKIIFTPMSNVTAGSGSNTLDWINQGIALANSSSDYGKILVSSGILTLDATHTSTGSIAIGTKAIVNSAGTLSYGGLFGTAYIWAFDGGSAGTRWGAGIQANTWEVFGPTNSSNKFTWNSGGDLQAVGTNELMRLVQNTTPCLVIGTTTCGASLSLALVSGAQALTYKGIGTATFTPQTGAGAGATAVCATSHICDSFSGEVTLTTGSVGTPATGSQLLITLGTTRTNIPNCLVTVEGGTTFLGITSPETTTGITVSAGVALVFATPYTVKYACGGQ